MGKKGTLEQSISCATLDRSGFGYHSQGKGIKEYFTGVLEKRRKKKIDPREFVSLQFNADYFGAMFYPVCVETMHANFTYFGLTRDVVYNPRQAKIPRRDIDAMRNVGILFENSLMLERVNRFSVQEIDDNCIALDLMVTLHQGLQNDEPERQYSRIYAIC